MKTNANDIYSSSVLFYNLFYWFTLSSVLDSVVEFFLIIAYMEHLFPVLKLLDLFMVWDWSTYLADYGQPTSKYLRVNPSTALALLEKYVLFSTLSFSSVKKC